MLHDWSRTVCRRCAAAKRSSEGLLLKQICRKLLADWYLQILQLPEILSPDLEDVEDGPCIGNHVYYAEVQYKSAVYQRGSFIHYSRTCSLVMFLPLGKDFRSDTPVRTFG